MTPERELEYLREEHDLTEKRTSDMIDFVREKFPEEAANIEFDVEVWDVVKTLLERLWRWER